METDALHGETGIYTWVQRNGIDEALNVLWRFILG
jgi:hypothetical protein